MKLCLPLLVYLACAITAQAQECGKVEFDRGSGFAQLAGMIISADVPATGVICYSVPISGGQDTKVRLLSGEGIMWSWTGFDPREGVTGPMSADSTIFEFKNRATLFIAQVEGATKMQRIKISISTNPDDD
ncbi:hypothetical protein [Neogemmobacter tilapiae]|nr:hypothetical protein [Gemmobacter tilapiae]